MNEHNEIAINNYHYYYSKLSVENRMSE